MTYRTDETGRDDRVLLSNAAVHDVFEVLGAVPVGVLVLKADASLVYANGAAHTLFGSEGESLTLVDTLCPADGREIQEHLVAGNQFEAIVAAPHCHRQVMVSVATCSSGRTPDFVVSLTDITALKQATERAEFLAHHDPLTRLGNRTLLQSVWDVLEERLAAGSTEVHAMALDLDRFKEVNDAHGHAVGDVVLRLAAERLRLVVGDSGHVFRFGGDEFFVLVDDVPRDVAIEIGRSIVEEIGRPMTVQGHDVTIGCSVGIASAPLDGIRRDALHRAADMALYDVKRSGRGDVICFDPGHEQTELNRRLLQTDLVLAVANGGFELTFRHQFDSQSGELVGAETLVAWKSTRLGREIAAPELHAVATETGLRHLLDIWTLRTAIAAFSGLRDDGWACPVLSVGVGATTLMREETVDLVLRALADNALPPEQLEIQIAEGDLSSADDALSLAMRRLAGAGLRIAVQGFCSGFPDLRHLRSLGVMRLTFDREVASRLLNDESAGALIAPLQLHCDELNIDLSIDGVETAEHWNAVRRMGRMRGQGAYLDAAAPPLPQRVAEEATR